MKGLFDGNVLIGCFVYFVADELALNLAKNILTSNTLLEKLEIEINSKMW